MYENVENFIKWLKKVSKEKVDEYYIKKTLEDLEIRFYNNDNYKVYELNSIETKSKRPETYAYDTEITFNENNDVAVIFKF